MPAPAQPDNRKLRIKNLTKGTMLADRANIADTSATRNRGLLKHTGLEPGEGLWIVPTQSVHCFGMKFTIDVLYLNKKRQVLKLRPQMVKNRISVCLMAHSVVELPAGTIAATNTEKGDQLELERYQA